MGSRPVRVGNAAYDHVQKDCEGDFMNALYLYYLRSRYRKYILDSMPSIDAISRWCIGSWRHKSTSLWEERTEKKHFVHTKMMDWVALDRACRLKIAAGQDRAARRLRWESEAIKNDILKKGFDPKINSFVKYYGTTQTDAALLTMPIYGFMDANDARYIGTFNRIIERLMLASGLLLRREGDYEGRDSHPFTLVSTWFARVCIRMGRRDKAKAAINNLLRYSTSSMLLAERADEKARRPVGNFPQLFPHAGLVQAILEYEHPKLMLA